MGVRDLEGVREEVDERGAGALRLELEVGLDDDLDGAVRRRVDYRRNNSC